MKAFSIEELTLFVPNQWDAPWAERMLPHAAALVRDASPGSRVRHQDGAGAARTPGRDDNDGVHARVEPWRVGCPEPRGQTIRECRVAGLGSCG